MKASLVERFNRTFQSSLYRYKMLKLKKYLKEFTKLAVAKYNDRVHSVTGIAPSRITPENSGKLFNENREAQKQKSVE